jgi:succinate dehydrogenase/fumarate reductase cytochrome b subunit
MNLLNLVNVAYAQGTSAAQPFIQKINRLIINPIIYFLFAAALAYFIYGIFMFLANADNEEEREKGKQHMLWGIIGMFIMFGVYGIMTIIIKTIGAYRPAR